MTTEIKPYTMYRGKPILDVRPKAAPEGATIMIRTEDGTFEMPREHMRYGAAVAPARENRPFHTLQMAADLRPEKILALNADAKQELRTTAAALLLLLKEE